MRRSWREQKPTGLFRGAELPRLMTTLVMLAVVLMLVVRTRNPAMWTWLAGGPAKPAGSAPAVVKPDKRESQGDIKGDRKPAGEQSEASLPQDVATGDTDEDPDEAHEAAMEFQAVSDGTLVPQREEMVPYDRIVRWVQNQPYNVLRRRARSDLMFTDFYQRPDDYRGQIVYLELNVRRVQDVGKSTNGVPLHEVWGFTSESGSRLYDAVVIDFPPGMPQGASVYERARFVGYFFKLQGYVAVGAKLGAVPEKAPMLIGRLQWEPVAAPSAGNESSERVWVLALLTILAAGFGLRLAYFWLRRKPARKTMPTAILDSGESLPIEAWLEQATAESDRNKEDPSADPSPRNNDQPPADGP